MNAQQPYRIPAASISLLVFFLAIFLRAPSCYESLWLDELHSAWCIWNTFGDVGIRAEAGHQLPIYFWFLWCWKQLFGVSEFALRMSSVIAVSASCGLLTYFTTTRFRSLAGGLTAGMVLAIEKNSIFFGTELRPYGFILLTSTIAVICFLSLFNSTDENQSSRTKTWWTLLLAVAAGFVIQPTSICTLIFLPIVLLLCQKIQLSRNSVAAGKGFRIAPWILACLISAAFVTQTTLLDSWEDRSLWSAFGKTNSITEAINIWDWLSLWIAPVTALIITLTIGGFKQSWDRHRSLLATLACLALLCTAITGFYWVLSLRPIVPLWHRRYFIGVLPIFACLMGCVVVFLGRSLRTDKTTFTLQRIVIHPFILSLLLITTLGWRQGLIQKIHRYPIAYATRNEGWRDAVQYINEVVNDKDVLWVSPGLIEERKYRETHRSRLPLKSKNDKIDREQYLLYAVQGPYATDHPARVWMGRLKRLPSPGRNILLARTPATRLGATFANAKEIVSFGGLCVIILDGAR